MWNTNIGDFMQKRVVAVFLCFCLIMGGLCLRLFVLTTGSQTVGYMTSHSKKVVIDALRLPIYDCKGDLLVNEKKENYFAAKPSDETFDFIRKNLNEDQQTSINSQLFQGSAGYVNIKDKYFDATDDYIVLKKNVRYWDNQQATHLIGYINSDGDGVCGIEKSFDEILKTDIDLYAGFMCDGTGRFINGGQIETDVRYEVNNGGVYLTIDKDIQSVVEEQLRASSIKKGAVIVSDIKTGEIKALASVPEYDPDDVSASLDDENSPLTNRALSAYAPGSVFKVVVAAAALENGVSENFSYHCNGQINAGGTVFRCNNSVAHGEMDMESALCESCNCYFIALGEKVGAKAVLETANAFGFGQNIEIAKEIYSAKGTLPDIKSIENEGALANFSFGQGRLCATPVQMINVFNAVANGGEYTLPYCVDYAADLSGKKVFGFTPKAPVRAISKENANKLLLMLQTVVEKGTAKNAGSQLFSSAGKTATAQTGIYNENGEEQLCTWFGGIFPADAPEYSVVIVCEGGTTGGENCAPVFKAVSERVFEIKKLKK